MGGSYCSLIVFVLNSFVLGVEMSPHAGKHAVTSTTRYNMIIQGTLISESVPIMLRDASELEAVLIDQSISVSSLIY